MPTLFNLRCSHSLSLLAFVTLTSLLGGCTAYQQKVPGSYMTPDKRVEGAVVGTVGGAIAGASSQVTGPGAIVGGTAGVALANHYSNQALMSTLSKQGVIVIARGDTLRLVLPADQFFQFDSPAIKPSRYHTLDYVAALLKEYGRTPIWVTGYTDNVASPEENRELSLQRARAIVAYLWVHGIEFQHLYAEGKGEADPVATNETVAGSAANRRIEITLKAGCSSGFREYGTAERNGADRCSFSHK